MDLPLTLPVPRGIGSIYAQNKIDAWTVACQAGCAGLTLGMLGILNS